MRVAGVNFCGARWAARYKRPLGKTNLSSYTPPPRLVTAAVNPPSHRVWGVHRRMRDCARH